MAQKKTKKTKIKNKMASASSKKWFNTAFGKVPFDNVEMLMFDFSGPKTIEQTAFIQYNLLTNPKVLQLHLEHASGRGKAIVQKGFDFESALKKLGARYWLVKKETIPYTSDRKSVV